MLFLTTLLKAGDPVWTGTILLKKDIYSLKELMIVFAKQTGFKIAYDTKKVIPGTKVHINGARLTPKQLLATIKAQTGITYRAKGGYVVLLPKLKDRIFKAKRIAELELPRPAKLPDSLRTDSVVVNVVVKDTTSKTVTDTLFGITVPDSLLRGDSASTAQFLQLLQRQPVKKYYATILHLLADVPIEPGRMSSGFLREQFLLEAGIANTEIFYISPTANFGLKFLHFTGTIYNFRNSTYWRAGIGSSYQLLPRWQIRAGYSVGRPIKETESFTNTYNISTGDTIMYYSDTYKVGLTADWRNFNLSAKYAVGRNFSLMGGLTYNIVKSEYSVNGASGDEYSGIPAIPKNVIPETMGSPFSNKTKIRPNPLATNTEDWFGFNISILYIF